MAYSTNYRQHRYMNCKESNRREGDTCCEVLLRHSSKMNVFPYRLRCEKARRQARLAERTL
jgi:hypothetical protein